VVSKSIQGREQVTEFDPVAFLGEIENAWQHRDGVAAAAGYTEDAVLIYGANQQRSGDELRAWPQQWFDYAKDLHITKVFRAFTDNCLASEWQSQYTHPVTGKQIYERGAEFFFLRAGKVYLHHMFEHTWAKGEETKQNWPAI